MSLLPTAASLVSSWSLWKEHTYNTFGCGFCLPVSHHQRCNCHCKPVDMHRLPQRRENGIKSRFAIQLSSTSWPIFPPRYPEGDNFVHERVGPVSFPTHPTPRPCRRAHCSATCQHHLPRAPATTTCQQPSGSCHVAVVLLILALVPGVLISCMSKVYPRNFDFT